MRNPLKETLLQRGRTSRLWLAILACLLTSAFLTLEAGASIDFVNQAPATPVIMSNSNAGTVTTKFTPGAGTNRLMLVAIATRYSAVATPSFTTVSYGGQALTSITTTGNVQSGIALYYLKETGIATGAAGTKILTVANGTTTNLLNMYVSLAVVNGVDQATSITGSGALGLAAPATTVATSYTMTGNAGLAGNNGLSVYFSNWNGNSNPSSVTGYTEVRDYAGNGGATNNINLAAGYKVTTGASAETLTSTAAVNLGAIAGVGLNPAVRLYQITAAACGDCHNNPPIDGSTRNTPPGAFVGSHEKHSGGTDSQYGMVCTTCHRNNTTTNHANGRINVVGSGLPANTYRNMTAITVTNSPVLGTCNNLSCHSTARSTPQYTNPTWGGTVTCLSCHGGRVIPNGAAAKSTSGFGLSTTHSQHLKYPAANINCNMCHSRVVTDAATLKQYSGVVLHNNGLKTVNFTDLNYGSYTSYKTSGTNQYKCSNVACHGGITRKQWTNAGALNTTNTCTHCHGQPETAAIPANNTDLKMYAPGWVNGPYTGTSTDQNIADNDFRVGAHFAHLSSVYMKKLKCNECHIVPTTPFQATHMTGPRYNSQTVTFSQASTANKNGLSGFVSYTAGTATKAVTCSTTYCHGSKFIQNDTAGSARKPSWANNTLISRTPSNAACGTCHGVPPNSAPSYHTGFTQITQCSGCHSAVVDASGAIINKQLHINGVNNYAVTCNGCHDYDTRSGGTVWGAGGPYAVEGYGAHAKHIEYLKTRFSVTLNPNTDTFGSGAMAAVCGVCHTITGTDHTMGVSTNSRKINFGGSLSRQFGGAAPFYNGSSLSSSSVKPKSCSNTDCHYRTSPIWMTY